MGFFSRFRKSNTAEGGQLPPPVGAPSASPGPTSLRDLNRAPAAVRGKPGPDEMRLRTQSSSPVTVTGEEHHQDVLAALPPSAEGYRAELVLVDGRMEVRIGGERVGGLTPKMTERFRRLHERAVAAGKRLTAVAGVEAVDGKGWQVTLFALPIEEGNRSIRELDIEIVDPDGSVLNERSRKVHDVRLRTAEGDWRTKCGEVLPANSVTPLGSTKPYIGHVVMATGDLLGEEYGLNPDWCGRCGIR